jgi:hypothetical protein
MDDDWDAVIVVISSLVLIDSKYIIHNTDEYLLIKMALIVGTMSITICSSSCSAMVMVMMKMNVTFHISLIIMGQR